MFLYILLKYLKINTLIILNFKVKMTLNMLCIGDIHIQTNNTIEINIFTEKLYEYIK